MEWEETERRSRHNAVYWYLSALVLDELIPRVEYG